jgi:hypothetical protein
MSASSSHGVFASVSHGKCVQLCDLPSVSVGPWVPAPHPGVVTSADAFDDAFTDAGKKKLSFLQKLLHILATADVSVVSWADDGSSFIVYDVDR